MDTGLGEALPVIALELRTDRADCGRDAPPLEDVIAAVLGLWDGDP